MKDLIEEYGSAVGLLDDSVCDECFDDEGLAAFVRENADQEACDFCGREAEEPIAACLADVVKYMESCLMREFADAANVLPWEGAEGGFQAAPTWDGYEILDEVGVNFPKDDNGRLRDKIADVLEQTTWCQRDPFGMSDLEMSMANVMSPPVAKKSPHPWGCDFSALAGGHPLS